MIIVYAAVAGQSVVKLYAAAMFPGFFLAVPLPRLHHRLGADQSEDRAETSGERDPRSGPAMGRRAAAGLFAQDAAGAVCGAAGAGARP